jgi:hypothetical protein
MLIVVPALGLSADLTVPPAAGVPRIPTPPGICLL